MPSLPPARTPFSSFRSRPGTPRAYTEATRHPLVVAVGLSLGLGLSSPSSAQSQADVDRLIRHLGSDDETVRADAACGLGRYGDLAKRAAPALAIVLQGEVLDTAPDARPALRLPRPAPSDDDAPLTNCADVQLDAMNRSFEEMLSERSPTEKRRLRERDGWDWEQGVIVWAIRRLEGGEIAARGILDLFRREPELRCDYGTVETLLASLGPTALPALDEGLRDEITQIRYFSARAIPRLRPLPGGAEILLQRSVDWDQGDVRSAAVAGVDAIRAFKRAEKEQEDREKRTAAMPGWDGSSEVPAYPGASRLCSGRSQERAGGPEIAFTAYATKDDPGRVELFYSKTRRGKAWRGERRVSVFPVSGGEPACGARPPKEARTVIVVSGPLRRLGSDGVTLIVPK